ncbi:MAG: hypothetical protein DRI48_09765 [Chloroflexi bacterium]|nr:MAG: hypothetical protein DRI48_09765 [Chloroflexota bacterium]
MSETTPSRSEIQLQTELWLREGIAAVKAGERQRARDLLLRVVEHDEENVSAWLWLSAVVETPEDQETCLANVLTLDPDNQAAARGIAVVRKKLVDDYVHRVAAAVESGHREQARELLDRVLEWDENSVEAWMLLSRVAETSDERESCLQRVLALDPGNEAARQALDAIRRRREALQAEEPAGEPAAGPAIQQAPASPVRLHPAAPLYAGEEAEERFSLSLSDDGLNDEYQCPYCAAPTEPRDRRCRSCGGKLWTETPRLDKMSSALWVAIGVQAVNMLVTHLGLVLFSLANVVLVIKAQTLVLDFQKFLNGEFVNPIESLIKFEDPIGLIPFYLGFPHELSPETAEMVLEIMPRGVFLMLCLPFLLSFAVLILLFTRWKAVYYVFMATAVIDVVFGVAGYVVAPLSAWIPVPVRVASLLLGGIKLFLAFQIEDDFFADEKRVLLSVDRRLPGSAHLYWGGRYAGQQMWALAALHLRQATLKLPDQIEGYVGLMLAYIKLGRPNLAAGVLEAIKRADPDNPKIAELTALMERTRMAGAGSWG